MRWPRDSLVANAADECTLTHVEPSAFGVGGARFLGVDRSSRLWLRDRDGRYLRFDATGAGERVVAGRCRATPIACAAAAVARRSPRTAIPGRGRCANKPGEGLHHTGGVLRRQYVAPPPSRSMQGQALDPRGLSWSGSPRRPVGGAARLRRHRLRLRPAPPRRFRPDRKPVQQARGRGHLRLDDGRATAPRRGDGGHLDGRPGQFDAGPGVGKDHVEHRAAGTFPPGRR